MKRTLLALGLCLLLQHTGPAADPVIQTPNQQVLANPAIDMDGYLRTAIEAAQHRASHRLSEEDFLTMSHQEGVIVLDARGQDKYRMLHIKGAINLNFADIDVASLKRVLPDKKARILIYCNNNFEGRGVEVPFPTKQAVSALNISTYITLYNYGYRNVYELGPQLNLEKSRLPFVSGPNP
jgi:phage shock protein E